MLNKMDDITKSLAVLGLSADETRLYVELLREPSNHQKLAHATGINRTKVYRLAGDLEKRSLITLRTDDRGKFLVAADPRTLEILVVNQEQKLKEQRVALRKVLPVLTDLQDNDTRGLIIHTYDGVEGFKQMLWHELKTVGQNVIFGCGTIEDLVPNRNWSEKHRAMTVEAGYSVYELLNPGEPEKFQTRNKEFLGRYHHKIIPKEALLLKNQVSIYNDTVATYHWRDEQKVGVEIINADYAQMMRQMFERYWLAAESSA